MCVFWRKRERESRKDREKEKLGIPLIHTQPIINRNRETEKQRELLYMQLWYLYLMVSKDLRIFFSRAVANFDLIWCLLIKMDLV